MAGGSVCGRSNGYGANHKVNHKTLALVRGRTKYARASISIIFTQRAQLRTIELARRVPPHSKLHIRNVLYLRFASERGRRRRACAKGGQWCMCVCVCMTSAAAAWCCRAHVRRPAVQGCVCVCRCGIIVSPTRHHDRHQCANRERRTSISPPWRRIVHVHSAGCHPQTNTPSA